FNHNLHANEGYLCCTKKYNIKFNHIQVEMLDKH
ncbi:hypothetical protein J2T17_005812, partial [Paenibacillus mucilaginosus]